MNIGNTGKEGEKRVAIFLRKHGYNIVKRNFQCRYGEIDIIAENNEYILFVEVKTRKEGALISGMDAVESHKQSRLTLAAQDYMARTRCEKQPRFDVAEVYLQESGKLRIDYLENAFT